MPKQPEKFDLKANVPVDMKLDKIYQNAGQHGPYIRIIAWIRQPDEKEYTHRSILTDYTLLGQLYQLGFAEEEDKTNDDDLAWVKTLKDGQNDVLRLILEEHRNERTGKKYTQGRITHTWDQATGLWADTSVFDPDQGPGEAEPATGPRVPQGPPGIQPPPGPSTEAPGPAEVAQEAPGAPQAPPVPAPTTGRTKYDPITIAYAYYMARVGAQAAGVHDVDLGGATTTQFIEIMRNEPPEPTAWFRGQFQVAFDATGNDSLPF